MSVRNTDSELYNELWIIDDTPVSSHGAHICKSGFSTHVTCGYVLSFNGFFINEFSFGRELIIGTIESKSGDSGGTVFSYQDLRSVSLIGIHSASGYVSVSVPLRTILDKFEIEPYLLKYLEDPEDINSQ